jgi:DNA-binding NarL/FixJ family response regulator
MRPTRVLLADGRALARAGIRALLQDFGRIEVVAEAGRNAGDARKKVAGET